MLYFLIKLPIRLALLLFCRDTRIRNPAALSLTGPLLVTANHPNSFLDAIIIGARFRRPVYFLARGDVFRKPWHAGLLRLLNMIPVYRMSEGKENLSRNEFAFEQCRKILSQNGIVLIFIEGISVNSHELQPFKKGAARIAIENSLLDHFRVLPLGLAYHSLQRFGKTIHISIGEAIPVKQLLPFEDDARNMRYFNEQLFPLINALIDIPRQSSADPVTRILVSIPALPGYMLHWPLFSAINSFVRRKTKASIFYDSVLFGVLFLLYPFYLLLLGYLLCMAGLPSISVLIVIAIHPLLARAVLWYRQ